MGIFGDWKGENLIGNIMFIYLIIMIIIMMFSPIMPREVSGALMVIMFGFFAIFIIVTPIFTFWIGYQKANTAVLWGWFDLEPGVVELTKIQIEEEVPTEDLSPKEKEDLKKFMDEYFREFKKVVPIEDLSEEEEEYIKQKEEDEEIIEEEDEEIVEEG